jgi:AcrR family transcriptional regulator
MAIGPKSDIEGGSERPVQQRLLDAAEELFSEHGFDGASVRDIAAAAGCNLAAVNYYFGGKDRLYHKVWRRQLLQIRDERLESINKAMAQNDGNPELEGLLRSFADAFIGPLADETRARRLMKLMAREMIDQHLPTDIFVNEIIVPTTTAMGDALLKAYPQLEQSQLPFVIFSIVGQLTHVVHMKGMFEQTHNSGFPRFDLTEAIDHVVRFSAAGIRAYAKGETK